MNNDDVKRDTSIESKAGILDELTIAQLRDLGILEEIGRSFLDQGPQFIAELQDAIHRHDSAALRRTAHTLKGVSAAIGATRIRNNSIRFEELGRAGVFDGADELLAQIETNFRELAHALEDAWARSE